MHYVRKLGFDEKPNYNKLRGFFEKVMQHNGWTMDNEYDWIIKKRLQEEKKVLMEEQHKAMMLGGNPAALSKSFNNKLKKTVNTALFNPTNTMKSKDQQLSQVESLKLQLKQRRKERLSAVLLAVDGIKTKTDE